MKKNLILAVVAVLAVGQLAQAAPGREGKPEAGKAKDVRDDAKKATESATKPADAKNSKRAQLEQAGLLKNMGSGPNVEADIAAVIKKFPQVIQDMLNQSGNHELTAMNQARMEGLLYLKDVRVDLDKAAIAKLTGDKKTTIEQAYMTLVTEAGAEASGWGNKELRDNLTALLEKTNEKLRSNPKDIEGAFEAARAELKKPVAEGGRGVDVKLEDINKFCKKV